MKSKKNIGGNLEINSAFLSAFAVIAVVVLIYVYSAEEEIDWTVERVITAGAAAIGILFALWRVLVADKQARIAESGLNVDRFQKGSALLNDGSPGTWFAGLQTLRDLAVTDPENHYRQVVEQICAFIDRRSRKSERRNKKRRKRSPAKPDAICGPTTVAAFRILFELIADTELRLAGKAPATEWPVLTRPYLRGAVLSNLSFGTTVMQRADLSGCGLEDIKFDRADLQYSCLEDASIFHCEVQEAKFFGANVSQLAVAPDASGEMIQLTSSWYWDDRPPRTINNDGSLIGADEAPNERRSAYEKLGLHGSPKGLVNTLLLNV